VDEYQDTAPEEGELHALLPVAHKFMVGDPSQAIYGFRGATVRNILDLAKKPGVTVFPLPTNYRSAVNVCRIANRMIANNTEKLDVEIEPARQDKGVCRMQQVENAAQEMEVVVEFVKDIGEDCAILCRTNDIKQRFIDRLGIRDETRKNSIPMIAVQYLRVLADPRNDLSAKRFLLSMYNERTREMAAKALSAEKPLSTIAQLVPESFCVADVPTLMAKWAKLDALTVERTAEIVQEYLEIEPGGTTGGLLAFLHSQTGAERPPGGPVAVMTCHGAKGLEWKTVVVVGCEKELWEKNQIGPDLEAERRLFYVAVTRAKDNLLMTHAKVRDTKWMRGMKVHKSRFLSELSGESVDESDKIVPFPKKNLPIGK